MKRSKFAVCAAIAACAYWAYMYASCTGATVTGQGAMLARAILQNTIMRYMDVYLVTLGVGALLALIGAIVKSFPLYVLACIVVPAAALSLPIGSKAFYAQFENLGTIAIFLIIGAVRMAHKRKEQEQEQTQEQE